MPALVNSPIRTDVDGFLGSTRIEWNVDGNRHTLRGSTIDVGLYEIASASIRVRAQRYIPELSMKAKAMLHKLYSFRQMEPNWDGYGGDVPQTEVIESAAYYLHILDGFDLPVYFTAPGPNGEIVLEYRNGKYSAEVFFEKDEIPEMILYMGDSQIYVGEINVDRLSRHFAS